MGPVDGPARQASLSDRLKLRAKVGAGLALGALLGGTYRVRRRGASCAQRRRAGEAAGCVYSVWHRDIWHLMRTMRRDEMLVLASEHRDGEIITRILERLGYGVVRGSSTHGGARALLGLARAGREGRGDPLFTVDGPRGPAHEVKPGAVFTASRAGLPIVPIGVAVDRAWIIRSWDRHRIGKPFARVCIALGEEIRVPPEASLEELEGRWAPAVAEAMGRAESAARRELGLPDEA